MSAKKLGRLAGLVLAFAAILGVAGGQLSVGDGGSTVQESTDSIDWV